ncbi:MAG: two-component system, response regulator YesN [Epulopiscium sp.]|jgi:two-component system response regulator YesN|nr:transcriptional regulator AraC family [Defluviitaleaceae bacterium]MDK2788136.1 two-component system, response regulator YesN [Candidatus Epulonipiscium sp.]
MSFGGTKMYKVLIVDDEMIVRIGLKSMIDWNAYEFEIIGESGNGEDAFNKFLTLKPDLVITDIKMPKKDGLWLTRKIKETNKDTQVIVLTCYDEFDYAREALKFQASDYILKAELEEDDLVATLKRIKEKLDREGKKEESHIQVDIKKEELALGRFLSIEKSEEDVIKDFSNLNIPIEGWNYCCFQLDFSISLHEGAYSQEQIKSMILACHELMINKLEEEKWIYLIKPFGNSITCFLAKEKIHERDIKLLFEFIKKSVEQYFNIAVTGVCTDIYSKALVLRAEIDWFYKAIDYLFYCNPGEMITSKVYHPKGKNVRTAFSQEYKKDWIHSIEESDLEKIDEILLKLINELKTNNIPSMDGKLYISHMLGDIIERFEFCLAQDEGEKIYEYPKYSLNTNHMSSLLQIMRDFSKEILERLEVSGTENSVYLIQKVKDYIDEHYQEKITLEDMADYVGLSKYYLSYLFKKEEGTNFVSYINKKRIEKAKEYLRDTNNTVSQIYDLVGFSDQQYFSKTFKKIVGMTVTEYRRNLK